MKTEHLDGEVRYSDISSIPKKQILTKVKLAKENVDVGDSFLQVKA
jgi:hypothetical protein